MRFPIDVSGDGPAGVDRRVLAVISDEPTGVGYVRFFQPFQHLRGLGFELATLGASLTLTRSAAGYVPAEGLLDGASMLMFPQMVLSPTLPDGSRVDVLGPLCARAGDMGIPIVYSVDDHLEEIEPLNPCYEAITESGQNLRSILDLADAFIATTLELATVLTPRGKPVHVLPNAVDPARWIPRRRASGELRVGWAGSSSHVDDLLMVLPDLRELQRKIPFRFVLMGITHRPIEAEVREIRRIRKDLSPTRRARADAFLELSGMLRDIEHIHVPFRSLESYFATLPSLDLDIGICPLLDTPFNRGKSALKFYEYAMVGTMTVASAVPPYVDEVSVTVANEPGEWRRALEIHLVRADSRERELDAQRKFVLANRNIEKLRFAWADALHAILGQRPGIPSGISTVTTENRPQPV